MAEYAHPEVLVSIDWLKQNLDKPGVRIVEVDVDPKLYVAGHIPSAVGFDWTTQLQDQVTRDIISKEAFEALLRKAGIKNSDTVIIYGDASNWFAAYGFWLFKIYGHKDVRLLNGGRAAWLNAAGAPLTPDVSKTTASDYKVPKVDLSLRAYAPDVLAASKTKGEALVDVRSPDEFTGKVIAPPGMSETAQRGGHVPGAASIPLEHGGEYRDRPLQDSGRAAEHLRRPEEARPEEGHHRLLPHRRAFEPHLVRPQLPPRLQQGAQLRRELDRIRQPHRRPHREALTPHQRQPVPSVSRPLKEGPKCDCPLPLSCIR